MFMWRTAVCRPSTALLIGRLGLRTTSDQPAPEPAVLEISSSMLLRVVRSDPGHDTAYYATKYFGGKESKINQLLWKEKRYGQLDMDRKSAEEPPRWFPVEVHVPKAPRVLRYRPEDHDLSYLAVERKVSQAAETEVATKAEWISGSPKVKSVRRKRPQQGLGLDVRTADSSTETDYLKDDAASWWRSDLLQLAKDAAALQQPKP